MSGWLGDKLEEVTDFATDPAVITAVVIAYYTGGIEWTAKGGFTYAGGSVGSAVAAASMIAAQRALTPSIGDGLGYSVDEMARNGTQVQFRSPVAVREIVYGKVVKSGVIIAIESTSNVRNTSDFGSNQTEYTDTSGTKMLHHTIILSGAPIGALYEIYINQFNAILGSDTSTNPHTKNQYFSDAGKDGLIAATDSTSNATNSFNQLGGESEDLSALVEWKINFGDGGNPVSGSNPISSELAQATNWGFDGGHNFWFPPRNVATNNPDYARANGVACLHIVCKADADKFPQVPTIRAKIGGRRLYDPRSSSVYKQDWQTTAGERSNQNPALAVLDFMTDQHYGMAIPYDQIDLSSFITAANTCDTVIYASNPMFSCNGVVTLDKTKKVILEELLSSCVGRIIYSNGKFKMIVPPDVTTSTATINEEDIVSDIIIGTTNSLREQINEVRASYVDTEDSDGGFVKTIRGATDNELLGEDLAVPKFVTLSLPFTNSSNQAKVICAATLYRMRAQTTVNFSVALNKFDLDIGDLVTLNLPKYGFQTKLFEVSEWSLDTTAGGKVDLVFREHTRQWYIAAPHEHPTVHTDIYYEQERLTVSPAGQLNEANSLGLETKFVGITKYRQDIPKRLIFAENFEVYRDAKTEIASNGTGLDLKPVFVIEDNLAGSFFHIHVLGNIYGAHGGISGSDWNLNSQGGNNFGGADGGIGGALFSYEDTGSTPVKIINDGQLWAGGGGGGSGGRGGGFIIQADGIPRNGTVGGAGKEGMGFNLRQFATADFSTWENDTTNNVGTAASTNTTTASFGTTGVGGTGGKSGSWGRNGFTGGNGSPVSFSGPYTPENPPAGYTVIAAGTPNAGGKAGQICTDANGYLPSNVTIINRGSMKGRITDSVTGDEYFDT